MANKKPPFPSPIPDALVPCNEARATDEATEDPLVIPEVNTEQQWNDFLISFATLSEAPDVHNPYGTHDDYHWEWKASSDREKSGEWVRSEAKHPMPVYGPVNWPQLWPDWESVGNDFTECGTNSPLDAVQQQMMDERCTDFKVTKWLDQIGNGAYGEVWAVECQEITPGKDNDNVDNFQAAVKVLRLNEDDRDNENDLVTCVNRMMSDMMTLRWLTKISGQEDGKNDYIVELYHMITIADSNTHFAFSTVLLVMEWCNGDLNSLIKLCGDTIPLEVCQECAKDIACGLKHLHTLNVVHLDIKPHNILYTLDESDIDITKDNIVEHYKNMTFKLADFGEAQSFSKDQLAITKVYSGTPQYMSPEMFALRNLLVRKKSLGIIRQSV